MTFGVFYISNSIPVLHSYQLVQLIFLCDGYLCFMRYFTGETRLRAASSRLSLSRAFASQKCKAK